MASEDELRIGEWRVRRELNTLENGDLVRGIEPRVMDVLVYLANHPREVLSKERIIQAVWPDTFVSDEVLTYSISELRKAFEDDAKNPRFIQTIPRRGYRLIAPVSRDSSGPLPRPDAVSANWKGSVPARRLLLAAGVTLLAAGFLYYFFSSQADNLRSAPGAALWQMTFEDGLQSGPTWSPEGNLIAYASNRGGNFDIWVQSEGGSPVQITRHESHDWQPDWSPDGKLIVFRSERDGGGLFVIPATGGTVRNISSFGYLPHWSSGGTRVLFHGRIRRGLSEPQELYVVSLDGSPPIQILSEVTANSAGGFLAAWHPDGKRISVLYRDLRYRIRLQTYPLDGHSPVESEIAPEVFEKLAAVRYTSAMVWAPSGDAIYLEAASRGTTDIWKAAVEPETLRWSVLDRLTFSVEHAWDVSVSRDGKRLAFSSRDERLLIWVFPFDAVAGSIQGEGRIVSPAGLKATAPDLSRDGSKLAFITFRWVLEESQVWTTLLGSGPPNALATGDFSFPRWSPSGLGLACRRDRPANPAGFLQQPLLMSPESGSERPLNPPFWGVSFVSDWSPDGKWGIFCCSQADHVPAGERPSTEGAIVHICLQPVAAAPHAARQARLVTSHPEYNLWQPRSSPQGQWILFNAVPRTRSGNSRLFVVPSTGGQWTAVTSGRDWADKGRWSPDGKTIYFASDQGGHFNVWGIRFREEDGQPIGAPFQVTFFNSPEEMIDPHVGRMDIAVSSRHIALPLMRTTGNIWVLENLD